MSLQSPSFLSGMFRARVRQRRFTGRMIERYRRQMLERLIRDSRQRVPFQAQRLRGVDPDRVGPGRSTPTSREELKARFDERIADAAVSLEEVLGRDEDSRLELAVLRGRYVASTTSGSSGVPAWTVHSTRDW